MFISHAHAFINKYTSTVHTGITSNLTFNQTNKTVHDVIEHKKVHKLHTVFAQICFCEVSVDPLWKDLETQQEHRTLVKKQILSVFI